MTSGETSSEPFSGEQATPTPGGGRHLPGLPMSRIQVAMPTGTAGRVLWWGGLAAVAAFGVVDWPVAVLVGAGSWVAEQYAKAAPHPGGDREEKS